MACETCIQGFQKVEKGLLWRESSAPGRRCATLGTIRDSIWLPWGHVNGKGDTFAWKERPASYCGGLKVKVSFWKQWGKLSILEKREAACYWQTENWGNWVWILPLSCSHFVALGKFLTDYKPWFPHLCNGSPTYLLGWLWELKTISIKYLVPNRYCIDRTYCCYQ